MERDAAHRPVFRRTEPHAAANCEPLTRPLPAVSIKQTAIEVWSDLRAGLKAMGFSVYLLDEAAPSGAVELVVEGSVAPRDSGSLFAVVTRSSSVAGAAAAIEAGAWGYFSAPFVFPSLGAAICAAAGRRAEQAVLERQTAKLNDAKLDDQTVRTVVGILMERFSLSRGDAYQRLRRHSRIERRKIVELARELLAGSDEVSRQMHAIAITPAI